MTNLFDVILGRRWPLLTALAAAMAIAGCGGPDESEDARLLESASEALSAPAPSPTPKHVMVQASGAPVSSPMMGTNDPAPVNPVENADAGPADAGSNGPGGSTIPGSTASPDPIPGDPTTPERSPVNPSSY
jgi:hypothetical protein